MIEMIKHELYKILSKKGIYMIAGIFLVIYAMAMTPEIMKSDQTDYQKNSKYVGPTSTEKVEMAKAALQELESQPATGEENVDIQIQFYDEVIRAGYISDSIQMDLELLQSEIRQMESDGVNDYTYKEKVLQYEMMKKLQTPGVYDNEAWDYIVDFYSAFGFILLSALLLFGLSPVFSEEYSTGMDSILLSTRHGKRKLVTAKIISSVVYVVLAALFFTVINVMVNFIAFGPSGGGSPMLDLAGHSITLYDFSSAEYFSYLFILQTLGAIAFGLLLIGISSMSKSVSIPIFTGGVVLAAPIMIQLSFKMNIEWVNRLLEFFYSNVISSLNLYRPFKTFNLLGSPVQYPIIASMVMIIVSVATVYFIYYIFKTRQIKV
jgi:ABC-type transport system involved in multi-copper enzyme maturation permease subunit